jgi:hypothetical protein
MESGPYHLRDFHRSCYNDYCAVCTSTVSTVCTVLNASEQEKKTGTRPSGDMKTQLSPGLRNNSCCVPLMTRLSRKVGAEKEMEMSESSSQKQMDTAWTHGMGTWEGRKAVPGHE